MILLKATTLDLVLELRSITKGWRIDPLVVQYYNRTRAAYKKFNKSESSFEVFANSDMGTIGKPGVLGPRWSEEAQISAIKIKIPNKELRICHLIEKENIGISYYEAEGFKITNGIEWDFLTATVDFDHSIAMRLRKIIKVKGGKRNRGKRNPGESKKKLKDYIIPQDPQSSNKAAQTIVKTIIRSYSKSKKILRDYNKYRGYNVKVIVMDGQDFVTDDHMLRWL